MSYFDSLETVVNLDENNTVAIRKYTFAERQNMLKKAMVIRKSFNPNDDGNMDFDATAMRSELLVTCVVSWNGPNFGDVPCTPENIMRLPSNIAEKILEEIDALNEGVTEDSKND